MAFDFNKFLFGSTGGQKQYGNWNNDQQNASSNYFNNPITSNGTYQAGNQYIQNMLQGGNQAFQQFEQPLLDQFNQQTVPGISNRFSGMGTGAGALNSSGFQQTLGQAGKDLTSQLGALRAGLTQNLLSQALGYAQQPYSNIQAGLQFRPWENVYEQPTEGAILGLGKAALGGAAQGAGSAWGKSYFG
jgi:hypothetical protein